MKMPGPNPAELQRLLAAPPPVHAFPTEVIVDLDGRELWRGVGPLCRADLRGVDLRRADLRERNLRRARLAGANLHGANLEASDLFMADLTGADLREAKLNCCDLGAASLRDADLRDATGYVDTDHWPFEDLLTDLSGADVRGSFESDLEDKPFLFDDRTRHSGGFAISSHGRIHIDAWLDLQRTKKLDRMPTAALRDRLGRVAWTSLRMPGSSGRSTDDYDCDVELDDEELSGCAFDDEQKVRRLNRTNLDGCTFSYEVLYWGSWSEVRARHSDFRGIELGGTLHKECDFRGSSFVGSNIGYDGLGGNSEWTDCDLRDCDFRYATLEGADLSRSKVEGSRFEFATYDASNVFPDGFDPKAHGMLEQPLPHWKIEKDDPFD
ncbi:Secreted effector protein PipB [Planctomycetes bacterium Pla163]|uniref:Secreted effector protein PipB n=1 Tax=Rohdeia mirabilis TaxID=2528008 RepID=A0A518D2X2_9BACT|nr:Secreted effector protein PipB [Planctomycetes bacterium Pla163]